MAESGRGQVFGGIAEGVPFPLLQIALLNLYTWKLQQSLEPD